MNSANVYFCRLLIAISFLSASAHAMEEVEMPSLTDKKPALSEENFVKILNFIQRHELSEMQKSALFEVLSPAHSSSKRPRIEGKENRTPVGTVQISPIKPKSRGLGIGHLVRKFSIYALITHKADEPSLAPPHDERVNFASLLSDEIEDTNLNDALLAIENWVDEQIEKQPRLHEMVGYIGLALNMTTRFPGHASDLKPVQEMAAHDPSLCKYFPNRKERYFGERFPLGYNVTMSGLIYNIPETYLPIVEVLVGIRFDVLNKGTTNLGNNEAWKRVSEYFKWKEALKGNDLENSEK